MPIDKTTLLAQSDVRLFGWVAGTLGVDLAAEERAAERAGAEEAAAEAEAAGAVARAKAARHRAEQLAAEEEKAGHLPRFARRVRGPLTEQAADLDRLAIIFAFSHEGRYTPLRAPALFMVRTDGERVWEGGQLDLARLGLAHLDTTIQLARTLRFWIYDRSAHTVRLDMSAGTVQLVVIDAETSAAQGRRIDLIGQGSSWMARLGQGTY